MSTAIEEASAQLRDPEALRELAIEGDRLLSEAPAEAVLEWAAEHFGRRFAVACSMQDMVLVHLASTIVPGLDVIFLDTGYHFAETIGTRDAVAYALDVNVVNVLPELSVPQQDAQYGPRLHDRDPDACCRMRKVEPLNRVLTGYQAWGSGVRREESLTRAGTKLIGWDAKHRLVKLNPLAAWTSEQVDQYAARFSLPVNPLLQLGYPSIGCAPCTRQVAEGEDARAGRWGGDTKTECGIHT